MATTYVAIDSQTLTTTASSVTFSSIPATYTDLVLVSQARSARAATDDSLYIQVNGDTATNYSVTDMKGRAGAATTSRASSQTKIIAANNIVGASATAGIYDTIITNFMNYSNSTTNKTVLSRASSANEEVTALVNLYRSTSAITQIVVYAASANLAAGSTFTLYGVASAAVGTPKATGGNIIAGDDTYWYHAFTASGTFTPTSTLSCDVLTIAGGGSGGCNSAGGGGAGGLVYTASNSLTASAYTVTVGAGGASVSTFEVKGNNGTNSTFTGSGISLTAAVGGGAGGARTSANTPATNNGSNGGSGGGGAGQPVATTGGTATSGQGNNGGAGLIDASNTFHGGGGGGAGATGGNATLSNAGNGGNGSSAYSTWAIVTSTGVSGSYAGGGGGAAAWNPGGSGSRGTGGSGGGGAGALKDSSAGVSGIVNTGGGGGGGSNTTTNSSNVSGAGGSGIVIVRYLKA